MNRPLKLADSGARAAATRGVVARARRVAGKSVGRGGPDAAAPADMDAEADVVDDRPDGDEGDSGAGVAGAGGARSRGPLGEGTGDGPGAEPGEGRRADAETRHRLAPVIGTGPSGLLDDANRAIIEALQRDGRLAYGTIAEEVGLSEAAVRRRVQRLREAGVMQIVAVTDPLQLGFHRQAMVGVRVEGDVRQVADSLSALDEVDYVVMCAGSFDLLVEVVCEDDDALFHLLNDAFRSIPGVRGTESFVYLKLAKQTYSWGTR
jgi:Lrp/AsnC family transcriptional regulator, regulator for asnA, asnC and gidA